MPLNTGEVSLNSLTMGGTSDPYIFDSLDLWASPDIADDDAQRSGDGLSVGADRWGGKLVLVRLRIVGNSATDITADVADLKAAWAPTRSGLTALTYNVDGTERRVYGRPRGADVALSEVSHPADCRFVMTDPYVYTTGTDTTAIAENTSEPIANAGNAEAPFTITIPGPCTVPQVSRTDDAANLCLKFVGKTVASGKSLVINTRTRTAIYDGTEDWWHVAVDTTGRPAPLWGIEPGGSTVKFEAATGTPSASLVSFDAVDVG